MRLVKCNKELNISNLTMVKLFFLQSDGTFWLNFERVGGNQTLQIENQIMIIFLTEILFVYISSIPPQVFYFNNSTN